MRIQQDAYWGLTKKEFYNIIRTALEYVGNPKNKIGWNGAASDLASDASKIVRTLLSVKATREYKYPNTRCSTVRGCVNFKHERFNSTHFNRYCNQLRFGQTL